MNLLDKKFSNSHGKDRGYWLHPQNSTEQIFQSGLIDSGTCDHQLIFCGKKVKWVKFDKHKNILQRSFIKHHTVHLFVNSFGKDNFLN